MILYEGHEPLCMDCASFVPGDGCRDGMAVTETTVACAAFMPAAPARRTCLECSRLMPPDAPGMPFTCTATASDASWEDDACEMFEGE
mgnify:CR=1 FL=1